MYILIYDSECIFCCNFIKYLNLFADHNTKGSPPLYIICPNEIYKVKKINIDLYKKLDKNKINKLSKSTIIFLTNTEFSVRVNALIKIAKVLRPDSKLLSYIENKFSRIISYILDPFYIFFARNRYKISKLAKLLIRKVETSCLVSSERIIFL